jgi:hypothetical protein
MLNVLIGHKLAMEVIHHILTLASKQYSSNGIMSDLFKKAISQASVPP